MTLKEVYHLLALIVAELPEGYPEPRLVIHESPEALVRFMGDGPHAFLHANHFPAALVIGMADAERNAVHMACTTIETEDRQVIADTLLHEIGHLYQAQKHGKGSPRYLDEDLAIGFARRWMKRLRKKVA